MYKKILSVMLVLLMLCSCFTVFASAEGETSESEELIKVLKDAYTEQWLEDYEGRGEAEYFDGTLNYFSYLGEAGCHVFQAAAVPGDPVAPTDIIGDYRFTAFMCMTYCDTNPAAMFAYKDGELMTLKEAYNKGLVDLDLLYEQTDKHDTMEKLSDEEILENKCKEAFVKQYELIGDSAEYSYVPFAIQFKNYVVFKLYPITVSPMESFQYLDGYLFCEGNIIGSERDNPTGLYTMDNFGNIESLYKTVSKGFIDLDEVYPELSKKTVMYMSGDVDNDKKLTVKDATLIQKYLANVPEAIKKVGELQLGYCVMEVDEPFELRMFGGTSKVTIKDATFIQKKVAKIIVEEAPKSFDHQAFNISIEPKTAKEYTPEDFPEFEVEKIDRFDSDMLDMTLLTVYLKNPGKDNIIDAMNSIRTRAEFSHISACYAGYDA
ncbi:MAG: hypothetical protein E7532_00330 [Ruminococcaceae bacterium]|nr:hypothetical protein [Oscillospiraceae bacterium]